MCRCRIPCALLGRYKPASPFLWRIVRRTCQETGALVCRVGVSGHGSCFCAMMQNSKNDLEKIESKIYLLRGQKVILDFDLATLYEVSTKQVNQQVYRNPLRFPVDFMLPLTIQELRILRSQFEISSLGWGGRRKPPLAFTEQGISMLSSVLTSQRAIEVNIAIMRTFVQLRTVLISNHELEKRITAMEAKYDGQFKTVFDAIREVLASPSASRKKVKGLSGS